MSFLRKIVLNQQAKNTSFDASIQRKFVINQFKESQGYIYNFRQQRFFNLCRSKQQKTTFFR